MNRLYSLMSLVLLLCLTAPQRLKAQNTLITEISEPYLAKLIDAAKVNQPRVKSLSNRVNIAQGNISRARLSYLDALTFSYVYQPNSTFNLNALQTTGSTDLVGSRTGLFKGTQFGVFFNLGSYLQKPYAVKQAKQELIIANNDIQESMITLTTQVKKRYYTYLQKVASLKLQMQAASDADNVMRDVKYKFQKGEETLDSYNKARISHTQQIQTKITAEADLFMAKADLEEIIGDKLENIK
ncbi:TolC family protein [Mucilaginibacter sp. CSA2-8R]|uniref:TolC family protein n=1 Tax=Mucilaginibacter sp. CSA2-8R TaxID=3141542 RepID=UPI00315C8597